jgi:tetraacyldisaccharide 4'-kinase
MLTPPEQRLSELEGSGGPGARLALAALGAASEGYRAAVTLRGWLYRRGWLARHRLSRPVISVGNLEAGGTGKTPLVVLLAGWLQEAGLRVAVVSRGWRGQAAGAVNVVSDGLRVLLSAREAGDEPYLLARMLPGVAVLTGARRHEPGRVATGLGAEVIVLDDGFQHLALARDLDIVVLGERFASGRLLPRGLLREPVSALGRAHAFVLTAPRGAELAGWLARRFPGKPSFAARHLPVGLRQIGGEAELPPESLSGRPVVAFCAIGAPERFRRTLQELSAEVRDFRTFPDHHRFGRPELTALAQAARREQAMLVTTEKDAARLEGPLGAEVWALGVRLEVDGAEGLRALVLRAAGAQVAR